MMRMEKNLKQKKVKLFFMKNEKNIKNKKSEKTVFNPNKLKK